MSTTTVTDAPDGGHPSAIDVINQVVADVFMARITDGQAIEQIRAIVAAEPASDPVRRCDPQLCDLDRGGEWRTAAEDADAGYVQLAVWRCREDGIHEPHPEHDGQWFPTVELAVRYALKHGLPSPVVPRETPVGAAA